MTTHVRPLVAIVLCCAVASSARTLKILADWYSMGSIDTILRIDSVYVPKYDGVSGYYLGSTNQKLTKTGDYAAPIPVNVGYRNDTLPDSLKVPTQLERWWFDLPDFKLGDYSRGLTRFYLAYAGQKHMPMLNGPNPRVAVNNYPQGQGQTDQLNSGFIDSCLQVVKTETVWIWSGAVSASQIMTNASAGTIRCVDHNPFLVPRGKVRLFVPQAGAVVQVRFSGRQERMFPLDDGNWYEANLYDAPGSPTSNAVTFLVENSRGDRLVVDSAGASFHIADTAATHWIRPAAGGWGPSHETAPPTDSVIVAWSSPWPREIAYATLGNGERIPGAWRVQGWYSAKLPFRPAKAWLVSGTGADSSSPVSIPGSGSDTVWLAPRQAAPDSVQIAAVAYDYALTDRTAVGSYFPFSQSTNTGLVQGLVKTDLGRDGFPEWTGISICGSFLVGETACVNPANSPSQWFRAHPDTNLEIPLSLTLKRTKGNSLKYSDSLYFPLDTITKKSDGTPNPFNSIVSGSNPQHNYGYCLVLRGEAQIIPGATMTFASDDDNWVFVDGKLVVDLGGQHGMLKRGVPLHDGASTAIPPVVRLDVFHCERHLLESGLNIEVNFPIFPVGWIHVPTRVAGMDAPAKPNPIAGVRQIGRALHVEVAAGRAWILEIRGLDGRLVSRKEGVGSAVIPWSHSGAVIAALRAGGALVQSRMLVGR